MLSVLLSHTAYGKDQDKEQRQREFDGICARETEPQEERHSPRVGSVTTALFPRCLAPFKHPSISLSLCLCCCLSVSAAAAVSLCALCVSVSLLCVSCVSLSQCLPSFLLCLAPSLLLVRFDGYTGFFLHLPKTFSGPKNSIFVY